jgi:glutamine---fructose-6-phosphate transaminase (isomerizing)
MRDHFLTEVLSQPAIWRRALNSLARKDGPSGWLDGLIGEGPVLLTGMGSSYYLSIAAAPLWRHSVGQRTLVASASDIVTYAGDLIPRGTKGTVIGVSRSGRTFETRDAVRLLREERGWRAIGVTCHPGTPLTRSCDAALVLGDAAEGSRFTTRAFTTTLLALQSLAAARSGDKKLEGELLRLPDLADGLLGRYGAHIRHKAAAGSWRRFIFLAQGPYMGLARELQLKTEEVIRAPAGACQTLEYLHGPKYAADTETLVTVLLSDAGVRYQLGALAKIKRLGANVAVVCERATREVTEGADLVVELRSGLSDHGRMLLAMPLMQLFVYHRAIASGRSGWLDKMVYPPRRKPSPR